MDIFLVYGWLNTEINHAWPKGVSVWRHFTMTKGSRFLGPANVVKERITAS